MDSFPFLHLPTEIQDKILEYHFSNRFDVRITQHVIGAHFNAVVGHRRVYAAGSPDHLSIMRVSRTIYEQARRALHRSFTGHLDFSSVQYSSKYSMSGSSIPIPPSLPRKLLTSVDLGKIEWREALAFPTLEGMTNLRTIKFTSSTNGKKSRNFFDVCQVLAHDDFAQLFNQGDLDHYFLEIVRTRADRIWKGEAPEFGEERDGPIRWELELIGESCPMVDQAFLTTYFSFTSLNDITLTHRAIRDPKYFWRSCAMCLPNCVAHSRGGRGHYCHGCTATYLPEQQTDIRKVALDLLEGGQK